MSSDEYEYEYESDQSEDQAAIDVENQFYEAEKCDDITKSISLFQAVVDIEKTLGQKVWTFQCYYNMVLHYFKLSKIPDMRKCYTKMLENIDTATRNDSNASIFKILNLLGNLPSFISIIDESIQCCESHGHDRTKVQLLLLKANTYFDSKDEKVTLQLCNTIAEICSKDKSLDNVLIEVYAIMTQIAYRNGNDSEVIRLYELALDSSNSNNKAIATIREIAGLYHMKKQDYSTAYTDFFEALKRYQEAGLDNARKCLVYLLMANILDKNSIDPFNSREAQLYANDKMITPIRELRSHYEANDLVGFREVLSSPALSEDSFVQNYSAVLVAQMSRTWIEKSCEIYSILKIDYISSVIQKTQHETELILRSLIVESVIPGTINQLTNTLIINHDTADADQIPIRTKKYDQLKTFAKHYINTVNRLGERLTTLDPVNVHEIPVNTPWEP